MTHFINWYSPLLSEGEVGPRQPKDNGRSASTVSPISSPSESRATKGGVLSGTGTKDMLEELRVLFAAYDDATDAYQRDELLASIYDKAREVATA